MSLKNRLPAFILASTLLLLLSPGQTLAQDPSIAGISPGSGGVGSSIYIAGSNFGTTQGSSTVSFNGVPATATSWSNTALNATVPAGATTGNIVVTVAGVASNGFNFIVPTGTPPSITLSASPAPNTSGWNNSNVTVTAACQSGTSPNVNCPAPQTVSTEGTNQIVSMTVTDANGLSTTATITLNIEKTPPALTGTSPADQSVLSSGTGSITGQIIPSLTAVIGVTRNGAAASLNSGAFSCNFSLTPGVNLEVVIATDIAGNTAGAQLHLIYAAPLPAPTSLQITPATSNVLVGATQQFTAVDQLGNRRTDASWTVDNTNIATISTDTSPILTGVAVGTVNLTASIGNVSAQVQVTVLGGTSLPVGSIVWSAPQVPGFTALQIVQAVPTTTGPALFAIDQDVNLNVLVRGITSDGQQLWQTLIPAAQGQFMNQFTPMMGDALGGLLLIVPDVTIDIDGQSGAIAWQNSSIGPTASVGLDGSVLTVDSNSNFAKVNPQSGQSVPAYTPPMSTYSFEFASACIVNTPVISGTQMWTEPGNILEAIAQPSVRRS